MQAFKSLFSASWLMGLQAPKIAGTGHSRLPSGPTYLLEKQQCPPRLRMNLGYVHTVPTLQFGKL